MTNVISKSVHFDLEELENGIFAAISKPEGNG